MSPSITPCHNPAASNLQNRTAVILHPISLKDLMDLKATKSFTASMTSSRVRSASTTLSGYWSIVR
jgi:hypothetical protein